jgi:hypothetical protein
MRSLYFITTAIICISMVNFSCQREDTPIQLFNGQDIEDWDKYLGTSLGRDFDDIARAATIEEVFSVVEMDGENVIRISGEINGSLATRESYGDYHIRLVFKWGETVYSRRNSGLLYHSFGDFGAALGTWMPNIEFQMMHQSLGDTYLMANTTCETEAVLNTQTNQFVYSPGAELVTFGEHGKGRSIRKSSDHETPLGQWNTIDLYCFGRTAVHVVNGVTVMVNNNTGVYKDGELHGDGDVQALSSGKIQIQSEGAELFIKSIELKHITSLPGEVLP